MPAPTPEQLAAIGARLRAILVPYEDRLEMASIYNIPTLRRPGAKAHDWFAFVKPAAKHVGFYLLPVYTFPALDEGLATELEGVVARAYDAYMGTAAG
jgi:hypothetical protein